jgi:hypothetical protein
LRISKKSSTFAADFDKISIVNRKIEENYVERNTCDHR